MPRSNRYYDDRSALYDLRESQRKQYDDPSKQEQYNREYDDQTQQLFEQMVKEMVGSGTNEPGSYDRAAASNELMTGEFSGLGYSRKKGKNERIPDGTYALAEYPQLHYAIWQAKAGLDPTGAMPAMFAGIVPGSPEDQAMQEKRRRWGQQQESMLKPGGFWNWM